nr:D-aspartate oxidase isoform X2 [Paramormyrops kingsleyae]
MYSTTMRKVGVAVVGAGVVGLSTAVCITEAIPHSDVTVLADRFTPNTTSDVAAGVLFADEFPDIPLEQQRRWFKRTFDHLLAIADSPEASLAGVFLCSGFQVFREVPDDGKPFWSDYVLGFRTMTDEELKRFPQYKFGQVFTTLKCECTVYLPWLQSRLIKAGGKIKNEKVTDLHQLGQRYDVIINCSGLGARDLVGDGELYPVRGQILKVQAPWLKHFVRASDGQTYIYPGMASVTLGGTRQIGDWRLETDAEESAGIMERCRLLEPSLRGAVCQGVQVGLRPGRRNLRLERELLHLQGRWVPVVHNYGHGGWGITLSWGTALDALQLVQQCLTEHPQLAKL